MNSKLDYLAKKEEELRKLNEQLEERNKVILEDEPKRDELEDSLNGKNPFKDEEEKGTEEMSYPEEYEEEEPEEKEEEKESPQKDDPEFEGALHEVKQYGAVLEKNKEKDKVINFQKARIEALQAELDDAVKDLNRAELKASEMEEKAKLSEEQLKKTSDQNQKLQNLLVKIKQHNKDNEAKISNLERTIADQEKDINAGQRDQKKVSQDASGKDAKINRMLEDLEKAKLQLKEAKASEQSKSESMRKDMDRVLDENRKLERQKQELLVAFKKQMKLIDVLKRQRMHIEAAKLLAFTEEEFVKTLELGDKL